MQKLAPGFSERNFWSESPNKRETSILAVLRFEKPFERAVFLFYLFSIFRETTFRACLLECSSCHPSRHGASFDLPWVPEGFFFRSEAATVSGEAAIVIHAREKNTLWTRQLQISLPCDFETKYLTKPVFAGSVCFCNWQVCTWRNDAWNGANNRKMKKSETSVVKRRLQGLFSYRGWHQSILSPQRNVGVLEESVSDLYR